MYARKDKGRLWKLTGAFFGAMLLFTLLSRAAYQNSVVVVNTAVPENSAIAHSITVNGKTVQNQELAVTTVGGLRVAGVHVNVGQMVKKGEVLFTLDLDFLEETILFQEQEMQKQKLAIQAAWSQDAAAAQQRSNEQARAQENYQNAVYQAQTTVSRTGQVLEEAQAALDAFQQDASQGAELTAAWETAVEKTQAAQAALDQLTQERDEKLAQAAPEEQEAIRETYAPGIGEAEAALQQAQAEETAAKAALDAYVPVSGSEADLQSAVEQAQQSYDDARTALDSTETTYSRAIQSAELPLGSSNAAQIGQITYDQMALTLSKLTALRNAQGQISAPADGIVTGSFLQTGEKTTDSTAVLLADLDRGFKFSGRVTAEQSQYIGVGDKVVIQAGNNGKHYKDLPVTTFSATEEAGGDYQITVQLPAGSLSLGVSAQLQFTRKSQPYSCCVPLSALRLDQRNQPYVLTVEEVDTVLGPQLQAKKVSVTILDQNETMAALAEGAVGARQEIIVGSSKAIEPGSRIRAA